MEPLSARMDFEFDPLPEGFGAARRGAGQRRAGRRPADRGRRSCPRDTAVEDEDLIRTKVNMIPESVTEIRVVDIVGLDKQADGGTHVRSHRRGRPHPGREDREQGQGQQAHPHRGRRWLTWPALRRRGCATLGRGRRGVQRRRRLGVPRLGRPRHARARAGPWRSPRCRRRWPRDELDDCRRARRRVGAARGRRSPPTRWTTPPTAVNDGDRCFWCKAALMDALEPAASTAGRDRRARRERRRPRRPPARAAGGGRAGRGVPAGRRRLHQGRRAGLVAAASACARGTSRPPPASRRACRTAPTVTVAVLVARRAGRGRAAPLGLRRPAGAPLRRHRPHRGAGRRPGDGGRAARGGGRRRPRPPGTAT